MEVDTVPFTEAERNETLVKMKRGKAPGPDYLSSDAVETIAEVIPLIVLNQLLLQQKFPAACKRVIVVLLPKGDKKPRPRHAEPVPRGQGVSPRKKKSLLFGVG